MTTPIEDFIANHHLVTAAEFAITEYAGTIERLRAEITALEAAVRAEKIAACVAGNRDRGRPPRTPNEVRLLQAQIELGGAMEAVEVESASLGPIREHVRGLYADQQQAVALVKDLNGKVRDMAAALRNAVALQRAAFELEDRISRLSSEVAIPARLSPGRRFGIRVGNVHQWSLQEQIERFVSAIDQEDEEASGRAAVRRERQQTEFLAELDTWRKAATDAETKVAAVPEVQAARAALDLALNALNAVPTKDAAGQLNADRVPVWADARDKEEAFWQIVCATGQVHYRSGFCASRLPAMY